MPKAKNIVLKQIPDKLVKEVEKVSKKLIKGKGNGDEPPKKRARKVEPKKLIVSSDAQADEPAPKPDNKMDQSLSIEDQEIADIMAGLYLTNVKGKGITKKDALKQLRSFKSKAKLNGVKKTIAKLIKKINTMSASEMKKGIEMKGKGFFGDVVGVLGMGLSAGEGIHAGGEGIIKDVLNIGKETAKAVRGKGMTAGMGLSAGGEGIVKDVLNIGKETAKAVRGKGLKKLTDEMKKKLAEHAKTESKKHIASMRMHMMRGLSFQEAHNKACEKSGSGIMDDLGKIAKEGASDIKKLTSPSSYKTTKAKVVATSKQLKEAKKKAKQFKESAEEAKKAKGGSILKAVAKLGDDITGLGMHEKKALITGLGMHGDGLTAGDSQGGIIEGDIELANKKKLDMINPFSIKMLSSTQIRNMKKGKRVRVNKGGDLMMVLEPSQMKRVEKTFSKGKGLMIQLTPKELNMNKEIGGKGIFGKSFDKWVGKTIGKKAKNVLYKGADLLKPLAKKGLDAAAIGIPTALGVPELIPVAQVAAKTAGMYMDDPTGYQKDPKKVAKALAQETIKESGITEGTPFKNPQLVESRSQRLSREKKERMSKKSKGVKAPTQYTAPQRTTMNSDSLEDAMEAYIQRFGEEKLEEIVQDAKRQSGTMRVGQIAPSMQYGRGIYASTGNGIYASAPRGGSILKAVAKLGDDITGLGMHEKKALIAGRGTDFSNNHGIEVSYGGHRGSLIPQNNPALVSRPELENAKRFTNIPLVYLKKD